MNDITETQDPNKVFKRRFLQIVINTINKDKSNNLKEAIFTNSYPFHVIFKYEDNLVVSLCGHDQILEYTKKHHPYKISKYDNPRNL